MQEQEQEEERERDEEHEGEDEATTANGDEMKGDSEITVDHAGVVGASGDVSYFLKDFLLKEQQWF